MWKNLACFVICILALIQVRLWAQTLNALDSLEYIRGTFFGNANNNAYIYGVAKDRQGNVYGIGFANSIPTTAGVFQPVKSGGNDVMVFKLNPDLTSLVWATYIGGNDNDVGGAIKVDGNGDVYIVGYTVSTNFPITNRADTIHTVGFSPKVFALKLSSDGKQLIYSRILGRCTQVPENRGATIDISPGGEAFVLATTSDSNSYYITNNAYQRVSGGKDDVVLTKLDGGGGILYSSYFGGSSDEQAGNICYSQGSIYILGTSSSQNLPLKGSTQVDQTGDIFIVRANDIGIPQFQKALVFGSLVSDVGMSISVDEQRQFVYSCGRMNGSFFGSGAKIIGGSFGGFVARCGTSLNGVDFVSMLGDPVTPTYVTPRPSGGVFVAGRTLSGLPITSTAFQKKIASITATVPDGFFMSIDSSGSKLRYSTYIGGAYADYSVANAIVEEVGCSVRVVFGITTHSENFHVTADSYQPNKLNKDEDQPVIGLFTGKIKRDIDFSVSSTPCGNFRFQVVPNPNNCANLLSVNWVFNEGSPSTYTNKREVVKKFNRNGTYTVDIYGIYAPDDTVIYKQEFTVNSYPTLSVSPKISVRCVGDMGVSLVANGNAVRYLWVPGKGLSDSTIRNPTAKPLVSTMYCVYAYDSIGCYTLDSLQVSIIRPQIVKSNDTAFCLGGGTTLQANAGTMYPRVRWSPPTGLNRTTGTSVFARPTQTTTYTIIASDNNGYCADTAKITVTIVNKPRIKMNPTAIICTGGFAHLGFSLSPAIQGAVLDTSNCTYLWRNASLLDSATIPNPTTRPARTTRYYVTVTNGSGCSSTDSMDVRVESSLNLTVNNDTTICKGSSVGLRASGGAQFNWFPKDGLNDSTLSTPTCTPTKTTRYTCISSSGRCLDTATVLITVVPLPEIHTFGDTIVCEGTRVRLGVRSMIRDSASNPKQLTFQWVDSVGALVAEGVGNEHVFELSAVKSKKYFVSAYDKFGCTSNIDSLMITVNNNFEITVSNDTSICAASEVVLSSSSSITQAITYQWRDISGAIIGDGNRCRIPAIYLQNDEPNPKIQRFVVEGKSGGCVGLDTVSVTVLPKVLLALNSQSVCSGKSAELSVRNADTAIEYTWSIPGSTFLSKGDKIIVASNETINTGSQPITKRYVVTANRNGCLATDTATLTIQPNLNFNILSATICNGDIAELKVENSSAQAQYNWKTSNGVSIGSGESIRVSPSDTTMYLVYGTDDNGCESTSSVTVNVIPVTSVKIWIESDSNTTAIISEASKKYKWRVLGKANRTISFERLAFKVRSTAKYINVDSAQFEGDFMVMNFSQPDTLSTIPKILFQSTGLALLTDLDNSEIEIVDFDKGFATSCGKDTLQPLQFVNKKTCLADLSLIKMGNLLTTFTLSQQTGDIEIESDFPIEDFVLTNTLGLDSTPSDVIIQRNSQKNKRLRTNISGLPSGTYYMRFRILDEVYTKNVALVK
jgi:hypothetical protein